MPPKGSRFGSSNLATLRDMNRESVEFYKSAGSGPEVITPNIEWIERNPDQPRTHFDDEALQSLVESIQENGLLQPVGVKTLSPNRYQLVYGERRLRAMEMLGRTTVPAVLLPQDVKPDEAAVIENLMRVDLDPFEEASAFAGLQRRRGYSHDAIAKRVGRSKTHVTRTLYLTRLPDTARGDYLAMEEKPTWRDLVRIGGIEDEDERTAAWNALVTGVPSSDAGPDTDAVGEGGNAAPRAEGAEKPETLLSAFSVRVAKHLLRSREALRAFESKPKALLPDDQEILREMRDTINRILASGGA